MCAGVDRDRVNGHYANGIADAFEAAHGIASADQVIASWEFDEVFVLNDAGYDAFEIYSAWVAGDFDRLAP